MDLFDENELKSLVGSVFKNAEKAAPQGYGLVDGAIKFDIELSTEKTKEGDLKAAIFSVGGKKTDTNTTRISLEYAKTAEIHNVKYTEKDKAFLEQIKR